MPGRDVWKDLVARARRLWPGQRRAGALGMRFWVALFDGDREIDGAGYARQPVFLTHESGTLTNAEAVRFDAAVGDWGRVTELRLAEAAIGGPIFGEVDLTRPAYIGAGDGATFQPGNITVAFD